VIDAPAEKIFDVVADPSKHPLIDRVSEFTARSTARSANSRVSGVIEF